MTEARPPHPAEPVLTSLVLALLGDVASCERNGDEARHWYRRALAAPDGDRAHDRARAALGTLPPRRPDGGR
ncbi:hypothetical protein ACH5A7_09625 [Streptomyces sp. NPDC018955]|uniref:hypothetical protein n=1 Tax=Streptomyces sp. NPDC018955 TaxID=3365055 RepID=UPI0037B8CB72